MILGVIGLEFRRVLQMFDGGREIAAIREELSEGEIAARIGLLLNSALQFLHGFIKIALLLHASRCFVAIRKIQAEIVVRLCKIRS